MKVRTYLELQDIKAKIATLTDMVGSLTTAVSNLTQAVTTNQGAIMASMQDVLDDLATIKSQTGDYIAARDQIDADLKAQIANLIAEVQADASKAAALQTQVDQAFAAAEALKGNLTPPTSTVSLATSFPDNATFTAAVKTYQDDGGPRTVTLDGTALFTGTTPSLDYFTQADGSVNMTNPNPPAPPSA